MALPLWLPGDGPPKGGLEINKDDPLWDGLQAAYYFGDRNPSRIADSSPGGRYPLTTVTSGQTINTRLGAAWDGARSRSAVSGASYTSVGSGRPLSYSAWITPSNSDTSIDAILSVGTEPTFITKADFYINVANAGDVYLALNGADYRTSSGARVATGQPSHVAFSYIGGDTSTSTITVWVNGVAQALTKVGSATGPLNITSSAIRLALDVGGTSRQFRGAIHTAHIWNRPLIQADVDRLRASLWAGVSSRIWVPVAAAGGGNTVAVPSAALTLTGFAPTVTATANQTVAVPAAALTLTSFAPTVLVSQLVQVPAAALTLTAYAPTVTATANQFVNPPAAALTLTGYAPTVLASGGNVVNVPAAGLTLTGHVPTVTATANQFVAVPAGALTLTGFAPAVLSGNTVAVPAGALTLTSFAPSVVTTTNNFVSVPAAALALTGYAPTVSNGVSSIPTMPPYITVWMWRRTA